MSVDIQRIMKLLEHWINHNEEHLKRFRDLADEMSKIDMVDSSKEIIEAAKIGNEVSTHLQNALNLLISNKKYGKNE